MLPLRRDMHRGLYGLLFIFKNGFFFYSYRSRKE
nr:MAG TPA: hypothetical protein [Caudoviricetes sp.]